MVVGRELSLVDPACQQAQSSRETRTPGEPRKDLACSLTELIHRRVQSRAPDVADALRATTRAGAVRHSSTAAKNSALGALTSTCQAP